MPDICWISHRGLASAAVENTYGAFAAAIAAGYQHLETDLRSTADGHLILCHDCSPARVGGPPLVVESHARAQLAQVTLPAGAKLMFFDQLLEEFADYRWILDIKPESAATTLALLERWMRTPRIRDWLHEQVRYLFWSRSVQRRWEAAHPGVVCMARESECRRAGLAALAHLPVLAGVIPGRTYALPPRLRGHRILSPALVGAFHARQARVLAFLPRDSTELELALTAGVDEVLYDGVPAG